MGKMLDSLVRTIHPLKHRGQTLNPPHREPAALVCDSAPPAVCEAASFIEVGAPNKQIEASPDVLAVPVKVDRPAAKSEPRPAPVPRPTFVPRPALETTAQITLETWPTTAALEVPAEVITYHRPEHQAAQEYAHLLARLSEAAASQTALFAGLAPEANAAVLVLNLAFQAAKQASSRIAVIDAAGDCPVLAHFTAKGVGLQKVLAGKVALADALLPTPCKNLQILSAPRDVDLSREALQWVFGWLRQKYDSLFVVGPVANAVSPALLRFCEAVYLVAAGNETSNAAVCADDLIAKGAAIRGIIKWLAPRI